MAAVNTGTVAQALQHLAHAADSYSALNWRFLKIVLLIYIGPPEGSGAHCIHVQALLPSASPP